MAAAALLYAGGRLALRCGRRVAKTRTFQQSVDRLQVVHVHMRDGLSRRGGFSSGHAASAASTDGTDGKGEADSVEAGCRAEAGQCAAADPRALSAAVADLAAQLQQALAAQAAAASGGDKQHSM